MRTPHLWVAGWAVGVALIWAAQPAVPLAGWAVPPGRELLGLLPDAGTAVTCHRPDGGGWAAEVWDLRAGRAADGYPLPAKPDPRLWGDRLVIAADHPPRLVTLDARSGGPISTVELSPPPVRPWWHVSANGHTAVARFANSVVVYDLTAGRRLWAADPKRTWVAVALSADGRRLALADGPESYLRALPEPDELIVWAAGPACGPG